MELYVEGVLEKVDYCSEKFVSILDFILGFRVLLFFFQLGLGRNDDSARERL